ncbi:hypothetical protein MSAN_00607500 [Mycena sanguinolenta]|uniref:Uncharacterized protein n=1 Tax=Mycena sanguinolenta TaxID=230812 RepID=A0A8H6Z7G8_9AGAR|nr:hypothetical protein MSAN_00607500 [Mycena sanguinolenta]
MASSVMQSAVAATDAPALVRALPYIQSAATLLFYSILSLLRTVFATATLLVHPIVLLLPIPIALLLYILAPFLVFAQLLLEIMIYTPYRTIVFLADAVYPAYVFLGVACIAGALLGWTGRSVVRGVVHVVGPHSPPRLVCAQEQRTRIT